MQILSQVVFVAEDNHDHMHKQEENYVVAIATSCTVSSNVYFCLPANAKVKVGKHT